MKRVLLLTATTGYQTRAFDEAAARAGIDLVFATDRCHVLDDPWRDRAVAIRFQDEESSVRAIVESIGRVDGVLAVGDRPTPIAAGVAAALGLPWHSLEAARAARNKRITRQRLATAGLLVPRSYLAGIDIDAASLGARIGFPAVIKPLALSASRGVMRVDDERELGGALERLKAILEAVDVRAEEDAAHLYVLMEEFIAGDEYAIEALMDRGQLRILAIFDKPDPLDGPFFEETLYVTPSRAAAERQTAITEALGHAVTALGLSHGPIHAECRVNATGVFVLEVASRPIGGLCARTLRMVSGDGDAPKASLEEMLVRHAAGQSVAAWHREALAAGVMMVPIPRRGILRGVHGQDIARAVPCIEDIQITAKPDQLLVPLPEGASYLGFIFARAGSPGAVERALRDAHAALRFDIHSEMPMLQSRHG